MEKTREKHLNLLVLFCMFVSIALTQAKSGIENYNQLGRGNEYVWMPVVHYEAKKGIYAELRYNYEDLKTFSFYGGKTCTEELIFNTALRLWQGIVSGNLPGSLLPSMQKRSGKIFTSHANPVQHGNKKECRKFFLQLVRSRV